MSKLNEKLLVTALASALLILYGPLANAEKDDDDDKEEVDIVPLITPDSWVSLGAGRWSGERAQLGMYDGLTEDDTGLLLDADIRLRDAATGTWKTAKLRNLGLDNREASLGYERQGNWGISVDYNQIPRLSPYTVHTGLEGIGTTAQTLVDIAADPGALGRDVKLDTQRDRLGLSFFKTLRPNLDLRVSFRNEKKEGSRPWGGYFFAAATGGGGGGSPGFFTEPIDSTTRLLDATLNYQGQRLQLSGGYSGSWYDNNDTMLKVVDEAVRRSEEHYFALPPDNEAHQAFLNGGYSFTPNTRATLKAAYTRQTQNDPFIAIPDAVDYPTPGLEAEVNTMLFNVGLTSRPIEKLSLLANFRLQDREDNTPVVNLVNATYRPQSYATTAGKAEATYLLPKGFALTGGVDFNDVERELVVSTTVLPATLMNYREDNEERTYRIQLRRSLSETLNGALTYSRSDREGSDWMYAGLDVNPIHMADRERKRVRAMLDWTPTEKLGFQLNAESAQDDYGYSADQPYGLRDGSAQLYSVDASYAISPEWQVTAWYSHDKTKANQYYVTDSGDDVIYRLSDVGDSVGLGVRGRIGEKVSVGADLQWTRNTSKYPVEPTYVTTEVTSYLPDIENKVTRFKLFAQYALRKNGDLRFDYIYERWTTNDWTWLMWDETGTTLTSYVYPLDGTTVTIDPKQTGHILALRYIYRFQ